MKIPDIIKEYINNCVKLSEIQISKLTPELKESYFRKRLLIQDSEPNIEEYEWGLMNVKEKELYVKKNGLQRF